MDGLEALKLLCECVRCENSHNLEVCSLARETIEKELGALKIIKKKEVAVDEFIRCCKETNSLEEYNNFAGDDNSLTQEEYDLLKEVLL